MQLGCAYGSVLRWVNSCFLYTGWLVCLPGYSGEQTDGKRQSQTECAETHQAVHGQRKARVCLQ